MKAFKHKPAVRHHSPTTTARGPAVARQPITPELRDWILSQARAGCRREDILKSMCDSGWQVDVATEALHTTLTDQIAEAGFVADTAGAALRLGAVPEPALVDSPAVIQAGDREVHIVMTMRQPRVVVFGGLLSPAECDELVALGTARLARSETVDNQTGGSERNDARTSEGMFFERGENAIVTRLEARISHLLGWPVENGEGLQLLRYRPGAEYKPHYDYFDPAQPGSAPILRRGGQRVGTLVMYLNTPVKGGATTFPDVGLEVAPVKGNAVYFSYDRPHPSTQTLHGGAPVLAGEKWVATKWLRQGRFD